MGLLQVASLVLLPSLPQRWAVISKTQMKNAKKSFNREQMKNDAKEKKEVRSAGSFFA